MKNIPERPKTKAEAIRRVGELMPGATNALIKQVCWAKWRSHVESNLIAAVLGSEESRRDASKENENRKQAESFLAKIGDYRTCLRLLKSIRKEGK